jgi:hypothetical protein
MHNPPMARLFPSDIDATSSNAPLEAATALRLRDELPDDWWVVHACHWTLPEGRHIGQGEIDFVVVSPGGSIGLIEQKNGSVTVEGEEYVKHYGLHRKSVSQQMGRSRAAVMKKLGDAHLQARAVVSILFVPNVEVVRVRGLGIDELALVDASEADQLPQRVERLVRCNQVNPELVRALLNFFAGELDFRPSLHALKASTAAAQVRLSGPLRLLLDGFSMRPMRLNIEACAGAGKSEFIRQLAERSDSQGRRTLVLCYNRPLSALLREALPPAVTVDTWLGFRRRYADALGIDVRFPAAADQGLWERMEAEIDKRGAIGLTAFRFDTILVDESQDLDARAFERLQAHLAEGGDLAWIGDPDQRLSESPAPTLEGFATLRLRENFRTPQRLARELGELAPAGTIFRNPHEGTGLTMLDATQQFGEATVIAAEIRRLLLAGHELTDLIILELGGLSNLDRFGDRIGEHRLRRFTGNYSDDGEQLLTTGDLDIETIGRFKGQQQPHVIVVGLNKDGPVKPRTHRALYVALTRATVGASVVLRRAPQNG